MAAHIPKKLLLVEDNPGDSRLLREMLNEQSSYNTELILVNSIGGAEAHLSESAVDLILLDLGLPDAQGLEAVRRAHTAAPRAPLVVLTGLDDEALAAQALKEGAQDFLIKGQIETRGLLRAIRYAIERKHLEEALYTEKERAQVTLNSIGDAVASTNVLGDITFINLAAQQMTGWSWEEAAGRPLTEVVRILDVTTRLPIDNTVAIAVMPYTDEIQTRADCVLVRRDGTEVHIEDSVAPIHDREGLAAGAVIVFRDVSVSRAMAQQMAHSAQHDFLTGLPNRMLLSDRIGSAISIAPRHSKKVAVLFLDLDGFKHINDSLGHPIGDKLLQSIAQRLVECVRGSDTVSRQGGDEFVVLLSEVEHPKDAAITARRMLEAVAETHCIDEHLLHVTTSIGVAIYPDDGLDAETLIKNADTAMYQAKENGRQSFQFFKPVMNVKAVERQSIQESLRQALRRQEFALHYQPKVDLRTGAIIGAEALIRWNHPTQGIVLPGQFIPIAEDSGLILPIGAWVLHQACEQAKAWVDAGLPAMTMAVNVSALEFRDEHFVDHLTEILEDTGLDPSLLELELTETVLMKSIDSTSSILVALRDMGVKVAVDDFGTGYSSLSYLRKFPVDALKIDQSSVNQIAAAGEDSTIVTAVIGMARSLKLRVVAEGVETMAQLAFLRDSFCDQAQGFYFSHPVLPHQFARLIENGMSEDQHDRRRSGGSEIPGTQSAADDGAVGAHTPQSQPLQHKSRRRSAGVH